VGVPAMMPNFRIILSHNNMHFCHFYPLFPLGESGFGIHLNRMTAHADLTARGGQVGSGPQQGCDQ